MCIRDRLYVLAPLVLIFVASLAITPIYHVRYLFPAAAPFALVAGAVVAALWRLSLIHISEPTRPY